MRWYGLDSSGLRQEPVEGSCEQGNETSGYIKFWKILENLSDWNVTSKYHLDSRELHENENSISQRGKIDLRELVLRM
jgi:hypothetical protein